MTFRQACEAVGRDPGEPRPSAGQEKDDTGIEPLPAWMLEQWQEAAWAFLGRCRADLGRCSGAVAYLRSRGLKGEAVATLGINARTEHMEAGAWGLPDGKKVWMPKGIVIPSLTEGMVHRLRIRLDRKSVV